MQYALAQKCTIKILKADRNTLRLEKVPGKLVSPVSVINLKGSQLHT